MGDGSPAVMRRPDRPAVAVSVQPEKGSYEMKDDIVIASAARTPVGSFNGAFATLPAHHLGRSRSRTRLSAPASIPAEVSEVILGQILTAGQGQNPGRQAAIKAGIPVETPA